GFHAGVWFRDDEIHVAGIRGAATVGSADCDFDGGVFFVDGIADDAAVVFDFVSRNTSVKIVNVFDADFLVRRERGFCKEVVEGAVALIDPQAGLGVADAVYFEEELESEVCAVEIRVLKAAEMVGEDDFFNFAGKTGADEGDGESFFFGGDFTCLFFECGDGFPIGDGLPVLIGTIVVVHHLLKDFNSPGVGVGFVFRARVLFHAAEFRLPGFVERRKSRTTFAGISLAIIIV
ncbi:MAG: hypothetical protein L6R36_008485, partial [Xanthoria steineri]